MMQTHYRKPIDWTVARLSEANAALSVILHASSLRQRDDAEPSEPFVAALKDDLNTPGAITELHRLARITRRPQIETERAPAADQIYGALRLLGFENVSLIGSALRRAKKEVEIKELVDLRLAARAAKNWAESDRIRDELKAMGVQLKDNKDGTTTWEAAR